MAKDLSIHYAQCASACLCIQMECCAEWRREWWRPCTAGTVFDPSSLSSTDCTSYTRWPRPSDRSHPRRKPRRFPHRHPLDYRGLPCAIRRGSRRRPRRARPGPWWWSLKPRARPSPGCSCRIPAGTRPVGRSSWRRPTDSGCGFASEEDCFRRRNTRSSTCCERLAAAWKSSITRLNKLQPPLHPSCIEFNIYWWRFNIQWILDF